MPKLTLTSVRFEQGDKALHRWIFDFDALSDNAVARFTVHVMTKTNGNLAESEVTARSRVAELARNIVSASGSGE